MSSIRLTNELLSDIQSALEKHDPQARDAGVGIQYLAALIGVLMAQFPGEDDRKRDVLRQLFQFSETVLQDHLDGERAEAQNNGGGSDADPAFGIWKPGQ